MNEGASGGRSPAVQNLIPKSETGRVLNIACQRTNHPVRRPLELQIWTDPWHTVGPVRRGQGLFK